VFAVTISATIILVSALSPYFTTGECSTRGAGHGVGDAAVDADEWQREPRCSEQYFPGQTEAALVVKPYIVHMTRSEIMALMTAGMATIATGVMVSTAARGLDGCGSHSHRFGAECTGIATDGEDHGAGVGHERDARWARMRVERTDANSIDALCRGTSEGLTMAINVMAMLIAFTALVALLNMLVGGVQWFFVGQPEGSSQ
jgi:CNT family concentrative nucleoside transporter